jgi:transposase
MMRKGIDGLAALVQSGLCQKPQLGRGVRLPRRRGDRIKLLTWDGQGFRCGEDIDWRRPP